VFLRVEWLATAAVTVTVLAACGGDGAPPASQASSEPSQWVTSLDCLEREGAKVSALAGDEPAGGDRFFSVDFDPGEGSSWIEIGIYGSVAEAHEAVTPYCFRQEGSEPCLDNTVATARWGSVVVDWDEPPEPTLAVFEACFGGPPHERGP
jgi:hypothetical protein